MEWKRTATGGLVSSDGKWNIRGPMFSKQMFWLYGPADKFGKAPRYTPTGRYNDCVCFPTVKATKEFVKTLLCIPSILKK